MHFKAIYATSPRHVPTRGRGLVCPGAKTRMNRWLLSNMDKRRHGASPNQSIHLYSDKPSTLIARCMVFVLHNREGYLVEGE